MSKKEKKAMGEKKVEEGSVYDAIAEFELTGDMSADLGGPKKVETKEPTTLGKASQALSITTGRVFTLADRIPIVQDVAEILRVPARFFNSINPTLTPEQRQQNRQLFGQSMLKGFNRAYKLSVAPALGALQVAAGIGLRAASFLPIGEDNKKFFKEKSSIALASGGTNLKDFGIAALKTGALAAGAFFAATPVGAIALTTGAGLAVAGVATGLIGTGVAGTTGVGMAALATGKSGVAAGATGLGLAKGGVATGVAATKGGVTAGYAAVTGLNTTQAINIGVAGGVGLTAAGALAHGAKKLKDHIFPSTQNNQATKQEVTEYQSKLSKAGTLPEAQQIFNDHHPADKCIKAPLAENGEKTENGLTTRTYDDPNHPGSKDHQISMTTDKDGRVTEIAAGKSANFDIPPLPIFDKNGKQTGFSTIEFRDGKCTTMKTGQGIDIKVPEPGVEAKVKGLQATLKHNAPTGAGAPPAIM
jgi:hypothetical protein